MTKDLAYTPELVCRMWTLFGNFSLEHSYHPFNSIDCSSGSFPAIPKVNVGPRGEYDNKWVKPGEKMIDLVGYESKGNSKLSAGIWLYCNLKSRTLINTILQLH